MNLYKLHKEPSSLHKHKDRNDHVPELVKRTVLRAIQLGIELTAPQMKSLTANPSLAFWYAHDILKRPWPPGEKAIAKNSSYAFDYAEDILHHPWPPGEKSISTDAETAYWYAKYTIKGKWPPGEKAIATDDYYKMEYGKFLHDLQGVDE